MAASVEAARSASTCVRQLGHKDGVFGGPALGLHHHRRLEAGKRKIQVGLVQQRTRQLERCRVAALGQARQRRAAR